MIFVPVLLVGYMGEFVLVPEIDASWGFIYAFAILATLIISQLLSYNGNWMLFLLSLKV